MIMQQRIPKLTTEQIQEYRKIFHDNYRSRSFGRDDFVMDYHTKIRSKDLSDILTCSQRLIQHITEKNGIVKRTPGKEWTLQEKEQLKIDYIYLSRTELESKYGCSYQAIQGVHQRIKDGNRTYNFLTGEVKHHIDGDAMNNSPKNVYVFSSISSHNSCHKTLNLCIRKLLPELLKEGKIVFSDGVYKVTQL